MHGATRRSAIEGTGVRTSGTGACTRAFCHAMRIAEGAP